MDQSLAKPKKELKDWLNSESVKGQLALALPKGMTPERFIRIALTATYRNPKLLACSQESFFQCLIQLGALGLEPDGRRAHLIPYGDVCTLIIDYKGIAEILRRNHDVAAIHCDVVGTKDHFEIRFGTRGILDHVPNIPERGSIVAAYSWVRLPDGSEEYDVMSFEEIETVRKRSKTPNAGPWVTDWNEMAKKTVFRRHSKTLPLSPTTREALERDNDGDALTEQERFAAAKPVNAVVASEQPRRPRGRPPKLVSDLEQQDASAPAAAPESPFESPGAHPTQQALYEQVQQLLAKEGFSEAELLALMKRLRMAPAEATSLAQCQSNHLSMLIEQWESALTRLRDARSKAAPAPQQASPSGDKLL
jgi:recombination protein RecT